MQFIVERESHYTASLGATSLNELHTDVLSMCSAGRGDPGRDH